MMNLGVIFMVFCLAPCAYASNFLFVPLLGEGSHYFGFKYIAKELIKRGHNATFLIDDRFETEAKLDGRKNGFNVEIFKSNFTKSEFQELLQNTTAAGLRGKNEYIAYVTELMTNEHIHRLASECDDLLGNENLMARLRESNFDVTVQDPSMPCPVVQYLRRPYVVINPVMAIPSLMLLKNRVPFNPSYMNEMVSGYDHKMSFKERFENTANVIFGVVILQALANPYRTIQEKYHLKDTMTFTSFAFTGAEMWLINGHFALDFPRPLPPNFAMVGGFTTTTPNNLSQEWETFLNSAGDDGVVLFSMGSYATGVDEKVAAIFAGAFAQLKQKVIWKLNGKPAVSLSPNVKVVDWIPQNDILAHPQIKVFVYHCGLNGIWEAVYHGVPMVAVPLFGDQFDNAQRIVSRGMGVKVDVATLTSDELAQAISTVIDNPSYKSNATKISSIFRDRRRTPTEEAADWLEYVIRHGGAKHLRSAALDLNIFQYLLLDVIAVLLVAFLTLVTILICFCRLCFRGCRKVCGGSSKVKKE